MQVEVGAVVEGTVTGITKFGAFVSLPDGKSGLVHISEIANTYVSDVNEFLKLGDKVKAAFKAYYDKNYLCNTRPYDGMPEALDELKAMGLKIAVFSNKPDEFAGKVCTELFGDRFDLIVGNRQGIPVKPDPTVSGDGTAGRGAGGVCLLRRFQRRYGYRSQRRN